jgi:uncharacterized membrane protein YqjE
MAADHNSDLRERGTGELLKELSDHTTTLVRQEIELAKAELGEKGKKASVGAGMLGGAGLFAVFALAALTTCIIVALDSAMPLWLAALIPAVIYAAVAAALALQGRDKVQEAGSPVPEQATESVKEDVQWAKTQAKSGRT